MENRENIYLLAKLLGLIIEVEKDGVISRYRFLGDILVKFK